MPGRRILLSGGGTAGTYTPLLAVYEFLHAKHPEDEWLFVGSDQGPERGMAEGAGIPFTPIPAGKLRRYWDLRNIRDLKRVWDGYRIAQRLITAWKPDVVVSAGSYVSVPVVWAARQKGIPVLIHQQDVQPGLANRLMANSATKISVTFPQSSEWFSSSKVVHTGNPVRQSILQGSADKGREIFHLLPNIPILLCLGGSSGSQFINNIVSQTAYRLVQHWQIIHVTGKNHDLVELQDERYHRFDFFTWEIAHAMAVADVVVSRAGMGTLSELAALSKACIFIPMPFSHQVRNTDLLQSLKAGVVLDQPTLTPEIFYRALEDLRHQPERRQRFGQNLNQLYVPDATERIAAVVEQLVYRK